MKILVILRICVFIALSMQSTILFSLPTDSVNKSLLNRISNIENSTHSILDKLDSCCPYHPSANRNNKTDFNFKTSTDVNIKTLIEVNNRIDLVFKMVDSTNRRINLIIDSCCNQSKLPKAQLPTNKVDNCYCIFKIGLAMFTLCFFIFYLVIWYQEKGKRVEFVVNHLKDILPHLPFVVVVWTIGICLFLNIYCNFDFSNIKSLNYNQILLLTLSISLMVSPFLKTLKIGKYLELERNLKETKEEVKDFKTEIRSSFNMLASSVTNAVSNVSNHSPTFNIQGLGALPSDDRISELTNEIDKINEELRRHAGGLPGGGDILDVPYDNLQMFKVRYNIEIQLRRIWEGRFEETGINSGLKNQAIIRVIQDLVRSEIIDKNFYNVLREILAICNYAIHGESVTKSQVHFVLDNSKSVLEYLSQIK